MEHNTITITEAVNSPDEADTVDVVELQNVPITLSVSCENAQMPELFKGMWVKVSNLLATENAITIAPGLSCSRMVYIVSNPRKPHLVMFFKSGKVTCDCHNYSCKTICAHTLATAEKENMLDNFIKWFKKEDRDVNLWALSRSSGVPKKPGSKPQMHKRRYYQQLNLLQI